MSVEQGRAGAGSSAAMVAMMHKGSARVSGPRVCEVPERVDEDGRIQRECAGAQHSYRLVNKEHKLDVHGCIKRRCGHC